MTTKVILNAQAVRELISLEEGPVAELAKNATAQVAKLLEGEIVGKRLEEAAVRRLEHLLTSRPWPSSQAGLTEAAKKLMSDFLRQSTTEFRDRLVNGALHDEIRKEVRIIVEAERHHMVVAMKEKIDALILERFSAVFGGKA